MRHPFAMRGLRCAEISAGSGSMAEAESGSEKVPLFRQKQRGGLTYRIPALLYLPSEAVFLAFAEERSSPRDEAAKFLVMRRGQREGMSVQVRTARLNSPKQA
ncbi:sialidase-3-like [Varanus komodoensis]|uniref:sialidase-3-like n=1 Tax=Varanus komodoensis TaxID=61221 RepID=UPI001CF7D7DC|nr:sialidase-3-like [Varanus komodoensis]